MNVLACPKIPSPPSFPPHNISPLTLTEALATNNAAAYAASGRDCLVITCCSRCMDRQREELAKRESYHGVAGKGTNQTGRCKMQGGRRLLSGRGAPPYAAVPLSAAPACLLLLPLGQCCCAARPPLLLAHSQARVRGGGGHQCGAPPGTEHRVIGQVDAQLRWDDGSGRAVCGADGQLRSNGLKYQPPGHSLHCPIASPENSAPPRSHRAPAAAAPHTAALGSRGSASCRLWQVGLEVRHAMCGGVVAASHAI